VKPVGDSLSESLGDERPAMCRVFEQAIRNSGIEPPAEIIPDGNIHRFHVAGDKPGSQNGWYALHQGDPASGAFGF